MLHNSDICFGQQSLTPDKHCKFVWPSDHSWRLFNKRNVTKSLLLGLWCCHFFIFSLSFIPCPCCRSSLALAVVHPLLLLSKWQHPTQGQSLLLRQLLSHLCSSHKPHLAAVALPQVLVAIHCTAHICSQPAQLASWCGLLRCWQAASSSLVNESSRARGHFIHCTRALIFESLCC